MVVMETVDVLLLVATMFSMLTTTMVQKFATELTQGATFLQLETAVRMSVDATVNNAMMYTRPTPVKLWTAFSLSLIAVLVPPLQALYADRSAVSVPFSITIYLSFSVLCMRFYTYVQVPYQTRPDRTMTLPYHTTPLHSLTFRYTACHITFHCYMPLHSIAIALHCIT